MAGRKPKADADRKDDQLRIPLTASQKELIREVAELAGVDMTAWARTVLLETAAKKKRALQR